MDQMIASVRGFNRFYTRFVGALDADFLDSGMSLAEARVLFEIAQRERCFADDLQRELRLDAGFVSRVLRRFEGRRWISRSRLAGDLRRRSIRLTGTGQRRFAELDTRQRQVVEQTLQRLDHGAQHRLVGALGAAQQLLEAGEAPAFELRSFQAGDMGLIASRQSVLYRERYGWSAGIEVNIGEVTTAFLRDFKPGREQCWVAQVDGQIAGSVFLTDEGDDLCRLRLLYVEPVFHGHGIGSSLVTACVEFARAVGYQRMTLWTHSVLEGARRIYTRQGFCIVAVKEHSQFGPMLTGETWELKL
jgi:DNA-binding MarR family transcriptional regulator/predicted GNAT family acetyltransferase